VSSISSALVMAIENKPGDGLPAKRSFGCKSILDFLETHVCSLIYKFAFFNDCVSRPHFASFQGDMAIECSTVIWIRFPVRTPVVLELLLLAGYGKDHQPQGAVPRVFARNA
jgi:hypothetical protein